MFYLVSLIISIYFPLFTGTQYHLDTQAEKQLTSLIINHSQQQRDILLFHPILEYVARQRSIDMAKRGYFKHVNPEGEGPNYLVFINEFPLPKIYITSIELNYVESIAGGYSTANNVLNAFIDSPSHKSHILGENTFFSSQNRIGVGVIRCETCIFKSYWTVLIAELEDISVEEFTQISGPDFPQ